MTEVFGVIQPIPHEELIGCIEADEARPMPLPVGGLV
jgi:hypothetical protein